MMEPIVLRDGSVTYSGLCGLIQEPNPKKDLYPLYAATPPDGIDLSTREKISKRWIKKFGDPLLNQEYWSACGGMTMCSALEHERGIRSLGSKWAINFYLDTQDRDQFPGSERPGDPIQGKGTSMIALCREAKRQGLIKSWHYARTIDEVIIGMGYYGPCLCGFMWTTGMMFPRNGLCRPVGDFIGGHAHLATWVNLRDGLIGGPNSWDGWNPAENGYWVMTIDDFENRLHNGGECLFIAKA